MGLRNPFRIEWTGRDGELYVADYSPDAPTANPLRGPAGHGKWMSSPPSPATTAGRTA